MYRYKTSLLLLFAILVGLTSIAQKHTLSGYVQDMRSGEKIISANVYDLRTKQGTTTNDYGFFSLTLDTDTIELSVSFVGYSLFSSKFYLNRSLSLNIELDPSIQLAEVVITDKKSQNMVQSTQMSIVEMPMQQIKALPVLLGEADVLKSLQLMPGVQSGSEGSSGLYVRGGGPDQNLILLDGVPVYKSEFRCTECRARLKLTNIHRLKNAICPVCRKDTFRSRPQKMVLWN